MIKLIQKVCEDAIINELWRTTEQLLGESTFGSGCGYLRINAFRRYVNKKIKNTIDGERKKEEIVDEIRPRLSPIGHECLRFSSLFALQLIYAVI